MVVGIAGYIGSGKSTAGKIFAKLGAEFIEADSIVDELYQKGKDGYRKIVNFYGRGYLNRSGEIDRKKLAKEVFKSRTHLMVLEHLIHPLIVNVVAERIKKSRNKLIFVEGVKFDESGLSDFIDRMLWIDVDDEILHNRLKQDQKMIDFQTKPGRIDYVIQNNGTKKMFEDSLQKLYQELSSQCK